MKNPAFADDPLTEREAWLWLIEAAAYQPEAQRVGGDAVAVGRGEFATSVRYLAHAWKWEQTKVQRYLRKLSAEGMISRRIATPSATPRTVITLCKYDEYQLMPGMRATPSATPAPHLPPHPDATPSEVQDPHQSRPSADGGENSATPPRHTSRHKKANEALKQGGLEQSEKAAAGILEGEADSAQNQGQTLPQQMVAAFVRARNETFGLVPTDRGAARDYQEAARVAKAGLSLEAFSDVVTSQLQRLKARGRERPQSLVMFRPDFDARIAEAARRVEERHTDPERDTWLPQMTHFKNTGKWLGAWGPAPGSPGCDMPKRLQDECLASRKAAAA